MTAVFRQSKLTYKVMKGGLIYHPFFSAAGAYIAIRREDFARQAERSSCSGYRPGEACTAWGRLIAIPLTFPRPVLWRCTHSSPAIFAPLFTSHTASKGVPVSNSYTKHTVYPFPTGKSMNPQKRELQQIHFQYYTFVLNLYHFSYNLLLFFIHSAAQRV